MPGRFLFTETSGPRGAFWCEPVGGLPFWWPYCEIPGCPNGICFARNDERFCWPHSSSGQTVAQIIESHREPKEISA